MYYFFFNLCCKQITGFSSFIFCIFCRRHSPNLHLFIYLFIYLFTYKTFTKQKQKQSREFKCALTKSYDVNSFNLPQVLRCTYCCDNDLSESCDCLTPLSTLLQDLGKSLNLFEFRHNRRSHTGRILAALLWALAFFFLPSKRKIESELNLTLSQSRRNIFLSPNVEPARCKASFVTIVQLVHVQCR